MPFSFAWRILVDSVLCSVALAASSTYVSCPSRSLEDKQSGGSREEKCAIALHSLQDDLTSLQFLQFGSKTKYNVHESNAEEHSKTHRFVEHPIAMSMQEMVDASVDMSTMIDSAVSVPWVTGKTLRIYTYPWGRDDGASSAIMTRGDIVDAGVSNMCDKWGPTGRGHFFDLGANIGAYTIPMAACISRKGKVFAAEGAPSIAKNLGASVAANSLSNVELYSYAIGSRLDADSVVMEIDSKDKGHSSIYSLHSESDKGGWERAPMTTLDSILAANPELTQIRAMKIDIEGFEGKALLGAPMLFSQFPPCYLQMDLDAGWLEAAGTPLELVLQTLVDAEYDVNVKEEMQAIGPACSNDERKRCNHEIFVQQKDIEGCLARLDGDITEVDH